MNEIIGLLAGYLAGGISTGLVVSKIFGEEGLRSKGSGNIGATNVARVVGKKAGIFTLVGDMVKPLIAILLVSLLTTDITVLAITGTAAVVGHIFPIYYRFQGGKGVATALGFFLYLTPIVAGISILVFAASLFITRYVSLGSVLGTLAAPISLYLLHYDSSLFFASLLIFALIAYKHIGNMSRIMKGTEGKFGEKS